MCRSAGAPREQLFAASDLEPFTGLSHLEVVGFEHAPSTVDRSPLLRIPSPRRVSEPVDAQTAAELAARGVEVGW